MTITRLDQLRNSLAAVGQLQVRYWRFFNKFSGELERELGSYLGSPTDVALASVDGELTFANGSDRQAGLGFKDGKFLVPLKFRIKNLHDEGETLIRIHLCCTLNSDMIVAEFKDQPTISFHASNITPLLEYIFQHLQAACSTSAWFSQNPSDYQGTSIGFSNPK